MVPLHKQQKQEGPMAEHHVTCLPLHLTFLLSLIFPLLIFCLTMMLQNIFTMTILFSTARRAGSSISALRLYSSTRNIYRYYFWPYAPLPHSLFQVSRLISCCFLGTYLYDLTDYLSTNCWERCVHDPKTTIGQSLTCSWYCSEVNLIPASLPGKTEKPEYVLLNCTTPFRCFLQKQYIRHSLSIRKQHTPTEYMFR